MLPQLLPTQQTKDDLNMCVLKTLQRNSNLKKKDRQKIRDDIEHGTLHFFSRAGFTVCTIQVDEKLTTGVTRQNPADVQNTTHGIMTALKRAVLEYVREKHGRAAIKETGYGRKRNNSA